MINAFKQILKQKAKGCYAISFILMLAYVYGDYVVYHKTISLLSIIKYLLIYIVYCLFFKFITYLTKIEVKNKYLNNKLDYSNYKFILCIFLITWLPHLLIRYPIAFWSDEYGALKEGLGIDELRTHWPLFYTYLLTGFYKFGELIGSHNVGMFMFSFMQYVITANILAYVITSLNKLGVKKWLITIFIVFYAFSPFIAGNIGSSVKDMYYASYITLFLVLLFKYCISKNEFWKNKSNIILLIIDALLISLTRKNGLYVLVPTIIYMIIMEIKNKENYKRNIILLVFIIFISIGSVKLIESNPKAIKGSITEALSLPLQQTARFVKYHEELVTNEEKEVIDSIVEYDGIGERYNEKLSDPVKDKSKSDITINKILNYLKVWFKQFFRSPITYVEATASQNIYLIYPGKNLYHYNVECNGGNVENQDEGFVQTPLWLKNNIQLFYWKILIVLHELPIIELINNMAVYVILCLYCLIMLNKEKRKKYFVVTIPIILSILIIIAGPAVYGNTRYAYPIIWSFPVWFSLIFI